MQPNTTFSPINRIERNKINENWRIFEEELAKVTGISNVAKEVAEGIEAKVDEAIVIAEQADSTSKKGVGVAENANLKSDQAVSTANNVQSQFNKIIAQSGTSSTEVVQARVGNDGTSYSTLKARLDAETKTEKVNVIDRTNYNVNSLPATFPNGYTVYTESRLEQMQAWLASLGLPTSISAHRFIIETLNSDIFTPNSVYKTSKQTITLTRNSSSGAYEFIGKFERMSNYDAVSGLQVWSEWKKVIFKADLDEHATKTNNPHKVTSEQINILDRTNFTVNSKPTDFPVGISIYRETRTTQINEWLLALGLPSIVGARLEIETRVSDNDPPSGTYKVITQQVTVFRNTSVGLHDFYGIFTRAAKIDVEAVNYSWGGFQENITELYGSGHPEGVLSAFPGKFYRNTVNGNLFYKQTGIGNTGWKAVTLT